ncbi:MAG: sensor histidine kinase [Planctomycetaceae bacterium]
MFWNAAVVLLTAVATLVVLRQGVRYALLHEMDLSLQEDVAEIAFAVESDRHPGIRSLKEELDRKARGHEQHEWFVVLFDANRRFLWSSSVSAASAEQAGAIPDRTPVTRGDRRIVQHSLADPKSPVSTIRVGASLAPLNSDMARIDRLVMAAVAVALVIAPLGGYWLAGRATRVLADITNTAAGIRPGQLDERLPIRGVGDELDRLSTTVNELLDRIAHYLQQSRDLLANSAHELRSPLAAIRSSVEVALSSKDPVEDHRELLADVIEQCESLELLINQLLLLAETDADRLKTKTGQVAFDEIVRRSCAMFEGAAESRGVRLTAGDLPSVDVAGAELYLRQLMNNLLDNAIKFTSDGGQIDVELRADYANRTATLIVRDTGHGISAESLPHVFERFYRGDRARTRNHTAPGGTGLGLSICEAIVQAHGGTIAAESELGRGTAFHVRLPMAARQKATLARG